MVHLDSEVVRSDGILKDLLSVEYLGTLKEGKVLVISISRLSLSCGVTGPLKLAVEEIEYISSSYL
jgi:hypothetical protein